MSDYIVHKAVEFKNVSAARRKEVRERHGVDFEHFATQSFIAQPKYDGCNTVYFWNGTDGYAVSRTNEPVPHFDHLASFMKLVAAPPGVYLGEAWHENLPFPEISGTFRRKKTDYDKALLKLVVNDYLTHEEWSQSSSNVRYVDRVARLGDTFLSIPTTMRSAPCFPVVGFGVNPWDRIGGHTPLSLANELVAAGGYDGLILRDPDGLWTRGDNGKFAEIVKIKPLVSPTLELVEILTDVGAKTGRTVYKYKLKDSAGREFVVGSGVPHSEDKLAKVGQFVEVEALGYTADGELREPRAKGVRDDVVEVD